MKQKRILSLFMTLALLLTSCGLTRPTAATMHLRQTEGTVGVSGGNGEDIEPRDNLGLYSGYGVDTQSKSYAWVDLDEVKLTKLDENSEIEITKDGKNLEIEVLSGSLFFNVTEPLGNDEAMTIRASSMAVGIRGTCGWVTLSEDEETLSVYLLEGKVRCEADGAHETIQAGEMAVMTEDGEITVASFTEGDIPGFVMDELEEELLEEARSFLAQGPSPAALTALQSIQYCGDPAHCTMTPEQAAAFLQVIQDNMAVLETEANYFEANFNGQVIANGVDWGPLTEHPPIAAAALIDLGDGTPALIFGGALVSRTEGNVYHWLTSGIRGIWLYQDGATVQYAPSASKQAVFDGYLLTGGMYEDRYEFLYQVYPFENGSIAAQPSTSAYVERYIETANFTEGFNYYIDDAGVSRDAFSAWVDQWVHAANNPNNAELPWGNPQSSAGFASSTDISWGSWGMSPIEDVIAALEVFASTTVS